MDLLTYHNDDLVAEGEDDLRDVANDLTTFEKVESQLAQNLLE